MSLSLRFILPLALVLAILAYGVIPLVDSLTLKWFVRDLEIRSTLIARTAEGPLAELLATDNKTKLLSYFHRIIQDERLFAIGFCDQANQLTYRTQTYPDSIPCDGADAIRADQTAVLQLERGAVHVSSVGIQGYGRDLGRLMLVHDMSWVHRRSNDTRWYLFYLFAVIGGVISLVTVLIAHLSWRGWVEGVRAMLSGEGLAALIKDHRHGPELHPVAQDLRSLIQDLEADKRMRDESQMSWTPATLRSILHDHLAGDEVLIVSNRQPYIHNRRDQHIEVQVPASGVVTALEPIMRACSGVWIAHGSGTADREVVDERHHVRVPPAQPSYDIRRIWMSQKEEEGYYYGFSNEGLWPLCHLAHVRPVFRSLDWEQYNAMNERFAMAVVEEAKTDNPVVLVQDYHLALVPKLVRDHLPNATIITFWHIPWPNPERYAICPWYREILEGLLGSSILGFHTRFHCSNFINTVDRSLETRIDWDSSTITHGGKQTAVKHYPISIEWPTRWLSQQPAVQDCRTHIRAINGLPHSHRVGVGVERLDYTKGILERFLAVERLLELQPEWIGAFSFLQIAAPSRSKIDEYQQLTRQVLAAADRINRRFGKVGNRPILLRIEHHDPEEVTTYYRGADFCIVSSLHDGMNLVAKEFVAARDDEQGVLILSQFTGAATELPDALMVNPYNIDQCAAALHLALTMPASEQRARMASMRGIVQEFNVYRWAGRMLMDAARMRQRARIERQTNIRDARTTTGGQA
ncbi:Alpha,alpha-trehalose-phosphate synthase [Nitrospira sp. KM1]|uniref:alpha,alpha-trehalose-phosphate synthase (UDP-forming) n=1 Tax=Nitrospira sp. KM1 TaxID=1936990 RepID=UPI0013A76907|nr:trehalose-6-phosphate synthase [Nitrospira sp. KM1]BCA55301.1 Alpha,alpha-trehalose-phosphate synthase [Nitrospira sp. KM1]